MVVCIIMTFPSITRTIYYTLLPSIIYSELLLFSLVWYIAS